MSRSVKKCQELVTEVAKKYQDINFGTLLVQIRIVGQGPKGPVPLYELEQEVCRIAKNLTSWQFLTIRLSPTIIHEAFPKTVKKSPRPLKRPLRIIKKLLRTITTCQKFNKMPPRNSQDAVKNYQHIIIYSN